MKKLRHVTVTLCIGLDSRPRSKRWTPDVMHQRHVVDQSRRWTAFNCVARVGLAVSLIHSYSVVGYSIYLREHWSCSKDNYVAPGCLLKCAVNPMFTDHFSRSSRVIGQVCVCVRTITLQRTWITLWPGVRLSVCHTTAVYWNGLQSNRRRSQRDSIFLLKSWDI